MKPPFTIVCDNALVTYEASSLRFSNSDPGGFESCSFELTLGSRTPHVGASIRVYDGLSVAWEGRVEEPGGKAQSGRATHSVQAVGYGTVLKDNRMAEIYVDRDMSHWIDIPLAERIRLSTASVGVQANDGQIMIDTVTGRPAMKMEWQGPWGPAVIAETWYDAGELCDVGAVYYNWTRRSPADAANDIFALFCTNQNDLSVGSTSGAIAGDVAQYWNITAAGRFVAVTFTYGLVYAGSSSFYGYIKDMAVYGNHGLTRRGTAPGGFYTTDIVRHVLDQLDGQIVKGVFGNASTYIVQHAEYRTPVPHETIIDDMALQMGWHWGVWESASIFGGNPRLDFRPPPEDPTCIVSMKNMSEVQFGNRMSDIYDRIVVSYTDQSGIAGYVTRESQNLQMPKGLHRTIDVNMGVGSPAAAAIIAENALALQEAGSRGIGSCTLPRTVATRGGGVRPAHMVRAGLDRLRITDPPLQGGAPFSGDTRSLDTFRIKRVEVSVGTDGISTRVELDGGADLLEVIQARLQIATNIAGG